MCLQVFRDSCSCKAKAVAPAVDGLTLSADEHQVLALLGHNGAGKTTTINMLIGLLQPDRGMFVCACVFDQGDPPHVQGYVCVTRGIPSYTGGMFVCVCMLTRGIPLMYRGMLVCVSTYFSCRGRVFLQPECA